MNPVQQQAQVPTVRLEPRTGTRRVIPPLPTWRLNLMRVGYLIMGGGLAITKWPELVSHDPWELKQGVVVAVLVALSVLALLGLRYPERMLPILILEVGWKLLWLGTVALPLWLDGDLDGATRAEAVKILWVVLIIAVLPWRHVVRQFVLARGDRWH